MCWHTGFFQRQLLLIDFFAALVERNTTAAVVQSCPQRTRVCRRPCIDFGQRAPLRAGRPERRQPLARRGSRCGAGTAIRGIAGRRCAAAGRIAGIYDGEPLLQGCCPLAVLREAQHLPRPTLSQAPGCALEPHHLCNHNYESRGATDGR